MNESPVSLLFVGAFPDDPQRGKVADEHYVIVEKNSQEKVGAIRLRLSN